MEITSFYISSDRAKLIINLDNASTINTLKIWTDNTYKDYNLALDFSFLLTTDAIQTIELTLSDIGIPYFDGVYFVEVSDPTNILNAVTSDLTKYKECILNKLRELSVCIDCPDDGYSLSLINLQGILFGLEIAIEQGFINEIVLKLEALKKLCSNDCKTCGNKDNILDTNYYNTND